MEPDKYDVSGKDFLIVLGMTIFVVIVWLGIESLFNLISGG